MSWSATRTEWNRGAKSPSSWKRAIAAHASAADLEPDLLALMKERSLKDAVSELAMASSVPRNEIYRLALKLRTQSELAEDPE